MSMFQLDNIDDLGAKLAGLKSMTDVFEDEFSDDSWTTTYSAGKRVEFPTMLTMSKDGPALRGFIQLGRLAITRLRGAWQPMEDGPTVLTLDVFVRSFGEKIGVIVPDVGDRLLPPYSAPDTFANYFERPRLITGRVWEAKPEIAEAIGKILIAAGAKDRAGSGAGNGNGEVDNRRPWAFDLRLPAPDEDSGGTWATWGVDVGSIDIAVVPDDRRRRNTAARKRRADEAFNSFADGIVEVSRSLADASDLAGQEDEALSLQGRVQLDGIQRVLRSLTGLRTYEADGETRYAAREASVKGLSLRTKAKDGTAVLQSFDLAAARPAEATKEFSLDSINAAKARSEDVMSRRTNPAGDVPQMPEEPV